MPKKTLTRVCAAVSALALVLALVPGLGSAEKKPRAGYLLLTKQPSLVLTSIFPWPGQSAASLTAPAGQTPKPSTGWKRPTDVLPIERPGSGD
ncbi:MAG: hypothetical protein FJY82_13445 [Candidatus Aminicenantes bacterium]|nr:hypothetical protein [Candidatus Aminicenantes bacterium]